MAAQEQKRSDFYDVLGLNRECSAAELKKAYKKLAMKWHPDRCSSSGNSKHVEEAKRKFQDIQQAYSVLSDTKKRFLYDVGVYDCNDDDDEIGMGGFLNEMVEMMIQNKHDENTNTSFEEFQQLFEQILDNKVDLTSNSSSTSRTSSSNATFRNFSNKKRTSSDMSSGSSIFKDTRVECNPRDGRKQRIS